MRAKRKKNLRGTAYSGPKLLLNHGAHRYVYTIVAVSGDGEVAFAANGTKPTRDEIAKGLEGRIVAWGEWVGVYERKWI